MYFCKRQEEKEGGRNVRTLRARNEVGGQVMRIRLGEGEVDEQKGDREIDRQNEFGINERVRLNANLHIYKPFVRICSVGEPGHAQFTQIF